MYRTRGPFTERIHAVDYSTVHPLPTRHVSHTVHFPVPGSALFTPSFTSAIMDVSHVFVVKVASLRKEGGGMFGGRRGGGLVEGEQEEVEGEDEGEDGEGEVDEDEGETDKDGDDDDDDGDENVVRDRNVVGRRSRKKQTNKRWWWNTSSGKSASPSVDLSDQTPKIVKGSMLKVEVPVTIAGFPVSGWERDGGVSHVDALPLYVPPAPAPTPTPTPSQTETDTGTGTGTENPITVTRSNSIKEDTSVTNPPPSSPSSFSFHGLRVSTRNRNNSARRSHHDGVISPVSSMSSSSSSLFRNLALRSVYLPRVFGNLVSSAGTESVVSASGSSESEPENESETQDEEVGGMVFATACQGDEEVTEEDGVMSGVCLRVKEDSAVQLN
jgi:hypothetical protein